MKYKNMKRKFWMMDLQLFADDDENNTGGSGGEEDQDEDQDEGQEDEPEEKKFTQKDMDDAVKKRLAREKRKWQREQQRGSSGSGANGEEKAGDNDDEKLKKAEIRALKAETRAACFEAGVDKDAIDDVTALAHSYMAADEDLDIEDAIEKVVKKYPHFKNKPGELDEAADDSKGKSWGERQRGSSKRLTGVEAAFLKKNPGLKY